MAYNELTPRLLLAVLVVVSLAFIAPAAAQETGKVMVQPGDIVGIEPEPIILDLINLRDPDTLSPIKELRKFKDDDIRKSVVKIIGVPKDSYLKINTYTFRGEYGRYYPYSAENTLIEQHSIIFVEAQTPTPTETAAPTVEETPTAETVITETPEPTQAPLPGVLAIIALAICGFAAASRRR